MPDSAPIGAGENEGELAGLGRADAHQPRPQPVDRGGAQRLAVKRELEEPVKPQHQRQRQPDDPQRLPRHGERAEHQGGVGKAGGARTLGTEQHQPHPDHGEVNAHRRDQQHEYGSLRQRPERHPVEVGRHRHDDGQRQRGAHQHAEPATAPAPGRAAVTTSGRPSVVATGAPRRRSFSARRSTQSEARQAATPRMHRSQTLPGRWPPSSAA